MGDLTMKKIHENLGKNMMPDATDAKKTAALYNVLRRVFEGKNAIEYAAQEIAERQIPVQKGAHIYITVEDITLNDQTITITARENWQGDYQQHTLVVSLEEFIPLYLEARHNG